ncbi:patatin family protein [Kibdelosporangium persicum]|uniref:Phospholipase, patatin family n=1 Tax=Kibdelosporangium persicum TaxID=2698649 RepID=A0ABX2FEZ0_9PSEU|nr:patatin family protein [Kibdelosporangium persicum]NRN69862.1 Phospholipase, patatin family [Kibdelosporangium persicum]
MRLISRRHADGSRPGFRADGYRIALAIEGGSSRGTYSSGMVMALEELGLTRCFDAVYGSSAGALNGAWLLSGRALSGMRGWWDPEIMRQVINPWRFLRGRPVVDTKYLVDTVYQELTPMDFPAILANPVSYHPMATDAETGDPVDLRPYIRKVEDLKTALRATACLPVLSGKPVFLAGRRFVDGGVAEPLPFRTALANGATHVLMLRTRRATERPVKPRRTHNMIVPRALPGLRSVWVQQYARDMADEQLLTELPTVMSIRPPTDAPTVSALERDPKLLRKAVMLGRQAVHAALAS